MGQGSATIHGGDPVEKLGQPLLSIAHTLSPVGQGSTTIHGGGPGREAWVSTGPTVYPVGQGSTTIHGGDSVGRLH